MNKILNILGLSLVACLISCAVAAQPYLKASSAFDSYRGVGDSRMWEFRYNEAVVGSISSKVETGNTQFEFRLRRTVITDYSRQGGSKTAIEGSYVIGNDFDFRKIAATIAIDGRSEKLELTQTDEQVSGFMTRGGNNIPQSAPLSQRTRGVFDTPDVDLIEMYLASRDIRVGDSLIDSIFVPLLMSHVTLRGRVMRLAAYDRKELNRIDTAFQIHITEPEEQDWYVTIHKQLSHVIWHKRNVKVYQTSIVEGKTVRATTTSSATHDVSESPLADTARKGQQVSRDSLLSLLQKAKGDKSTQGNTNQSLPPAAYIALLPHVVAYFAIVLGWLVVVTRASVKKGTTWIGVAVGAGIGIVAILVQVPLQRWLVISLVYPALQEGSGSPLLYGILPALAGAAIQGLLAFLGVGAMAQQARGSARMLAVLGGALGMGFGFVEACFVQQGVGITPLFSMGLIERTFMLAFHVASAALFGSLLFRSVKSAVIAAAVTVAIGALIRYLPMLVQTKSVDPGILFFVVAIVSLAVVCATMLFIRGLPVIQQRPRPLAQNDTAESQPETE